MVGQGGLRECLTDPQVTAVLSVGRSATDTRHPKYQEIVHGFLPNLRVLEPELAGYDACFFCLGGHRRRAYRGPLGEASWVRCRLRPTRPAFPSQIFEFAFGVFVNSPGICRSGGIAERGLGRRPRQLQPTDQAALD